MDSIELKDVLLDFPILKREIRPGIPLIYLDSAATSQKPTCVIEAMNAYYYTMNANIHRGVHTLAEEATEKYETSRLKIAEFIGVKNPKELVFTRNTTESINLVANSWGRTNLNKGDVVILTEMEHHSNLVPWQILAAEKDIRLEFIPVTKEGLLDLEVYETLLKLNPKLVSFIHMSNVLGTINPAEEIISKAHEYGAKVLIDAAQTIPHIPVNAENLNADFIAFSAHKMLGPTGIGALWARRTLLEAMPPFLGGGDMIKKVALRSFSSNDLPHKFEAGTPAIAEAIGFGAAVDYLKKLGINTVTAHEQAIVSLAHETLSEIKGLHILGPDKNHRGGVLSFTIDGIHPHDVAQVLDSFGIAVRAGHHCAMPLHDKLNIPASTRASFYLYNSTADVEKLVSGIKYVIEKFG